MTSSTVAALEDESPADHAAAAAAPVTPAPPPAPRWARRLHVLVTVGLLAALVAGYLVDRSEAARTQRSIQRLERASVDRQRTLLERLAATDAALVAATLRVSQVEAELASEPDPAEVARRVQGSVFTIKTASSLGSAFVMSAGGGKSTLVTNLHVVNEIWSSGDRRVSLEQAGAKHGGTIVRVSAADDLALIEVPAELPALQRAEARPEVGADVLVVGSPLGLGGTIASGIVSSFRTEGGIEYLQFSAPVSPGSSGGPVVDVTGKVVGVAVGKLVAMGAEGLSFAIPSERICSGLQAC